MSLTFFIHLPMKMEPIRSSETSAIKTQTPGNYPKRNEHIKLKHGESLKTRWISTYHCIYRLSLVVNLQVSGIYSSDIKFMDSLDQINHHRK